MTPNELTAIVLSTLAFALLAAPVPVAAEEPDLHGDLSETLASSIDCERVRDAFLAWLEGHEDEIADADSIRWENQVAAASWATDTLETCAENDAELADALAAFEDAIGADTEPGSSLPWGPKCSAYISDLASACEPDQNLPPIVCDSFREGVRQMASAATHPDIQRSESAMLDVFEQACTELSVALEQQIAQHQP